MKSKEKILSPEEARKIVSGLVFKVLAESICVREAVKLFPPDVDDASIECAWHALVHYEADEDIRRQDSEYAKEQVDYLEMIAFTLQTGQPLPQNIINSYSKYYDMAPTPKSNTLYGWLKSLLRFTI